MAESIPEQIMSALATRFAALVSDGGSTCWYTVHAVRRCYREWIDELILDRSVSPAGEPAVVYGLRAGQLRIREEGSGGRCVGELEVFVLVARADDAPTSNPADEAAPIAGTVAARLERDVVRSLLSDVSLGGLSTNVMTEEGLLLEDFAIVPWITRELRTVVPYRFGKGAP